MFEWNYDLEAAKNQEGRFLITYDHRVHPSEANPVDVELVFCSRHDQCFKWSDDEVANQDKIIARRELPKPAAMRYN